MKTRTLALVVLTSLLVRTAPAAESIRSLETPYPTMGSIERLDPALDQLLAADAQIEKLAEGFNWSEGPVWVPAAGHLLFSDVPENVVYRWREGEGVSVFLTPSGFTGDHYDGRERGANGLALDAGGRLVLAQHGDRRVAQLGPDGKTFTTIADRYDGRRFNSPNDLCFDGEGRIYFTDPPYGLAPSSKRELEFQGVYRVNRDGVVELLVREQERPNGIALSLDERTLYVANSDGKRPVIMAYSLDGDGAVSTRRVFFDAAPLARSGRKGLPDGMKIDQHGNLWATGPGGVLILSPAGHHLGTILTGEATANCAFGGDGSVLYITADAFLCRVQTRVKGANFAAAR
jgi:gluconolactonase